MLDSGDTKRAWFATARLRQSSPPHLNQVESGPAQTLQAWREESMYAGDTDWLFASRRAKGKVPRSAGVAARDYLRPSAVKAGVIPRHFKVLCRYQDE